MQSKHQGDDPVITTQIGNFTYIIMGLQHKILEILIFVVAKLHSSLWVSKFIEENLMPLNHINVDDQLQT